MMKMEVHFLFHTCDMPYFSKNHFFYSGFAYVFSLYKKLYFIPVYLEII